MTSSFIQSVKKIVIDIISSKQIDTNVSSLRNSIPILPSIWMQIPFHIPSWKRRNWQSILLT